jgi:hypothetical protein
MGLSPIAESLSLSPSDPNLHPTYPNGLVPIIAKCVYIDTQSSQFAYGRAIDILPALQYQIYYKTHFPRCDHGDGTDERAAKLSAAGGFQ